ncbi:MAG: fumarylacetoacetate hydrolase family protein [Rhodocyclaceae bacterium]|nr:fumarylacetoacetate hydrolase family protein [Rhodocyclaceae bacterium]MDZ4214367.1 fumarylacetoacetate hydrolase family protein [Rhodocyclaceae bacterium]
MTHWLRFEAAGAEYFGTLDKDTVTVWIGDMFADPQPTAQKFALAEVRILMPCRPSKMIGLWNNFHERATKEDLHRPEHPLYFLKSSNCFAAHGDMIRRPAGYHGAVVFEAELGIVIGRRCKAVALAEAPAAIFGYTCVNDVTARDVMRLDPAFVHWTRAKSFDTFGVFGPVITTGLDPATLHVRAVISGEERQNYPVADMFFSPVEIVSRISHDMTLETGDVIACGTSVGAGPLAAGDTVEVVIDGVGALVNCFE